MSSRALRKLQREQELEKQLAAVKTTHPTEENVEEEDEYEHEIVQSNLTPQNAFDMLNGNEEADESDDSVSYQPEPEEASSTPSKPKSKSRKKKKQKRKVKEKSDEPVVDTKSEDEIDKALRELQAANPREVPEHFEIPWELAATKLLSIDQRNLDPINEMRGLFGNIALEGESRAQPRTQRRREINLQGGVDLATALTGRYNVASRGKELGTLAKRRNILMQGKEEWPLATSGGLSMENLPSEGFERRYDIVHNQLYRETQFQFRMAVESMQPENMIGLLSRHPYHIASLLQVSEIAKHQGDHSVAGDLLERALFTFGRSLHSSFPSAIRDGTARIPFNKPANREMYLAIWRFIRNLEQRGTWKTAFEWSKLLLQLNTLSDPFGVTLMVDQLALRGRQHEQLINLASEKAYGDAWRHLPNIQISLSLAYLKAQRPRDARKQLAIAMNHYPYILSALSTELEVAPVPKAIWGKFPSTDAEKLYSQLYVSRAKDLWNTPESIGLISEVANTLQFYKEAIDQSPPAPKLEISLEEARHIMLLENASLIALLPRTFTNMPTSASDVLPPPDSQAPDFLTARAPADASGPSALQNILSAAGAGANNAGGLLRRMLNVFQGPEYALESTNETDEARRQDALLALQEQLGDEEIPAEVLEQMLQLNLRQGEEHITAEDLGLAATPGDWDYYESQTENQNNDSDDMPELEEVSGNVDPQNHTMESALDRARAGRQETQQASDMPRGPHAATVEAADESDGDEPVSREPNNSAPSGRAVLRHIESDDDDESATDSMAHPAPTHTIFAPVTTADLNRGRGPPPIFDSNTSNTASPPPNIAEMPADEAIDNSQDPQRIQRWLLSTGLSDLRSNPARLPRYVERLKVLTKQQQNWIVQMVGQRAGKDLADRITAAL